jgi:putative ABC transport system substrate-binding protein
MPDEGDDISVRGAAMQRRAFLSLLGATLLPQSARAQQSIPVIGFLNPVSRDTYSFLADAFGRGLAKAGFVDGRNVRIEYRWGDGDYARLGPMASDLASRGVTVLAATGDIASARAAQAATRTIPTVFTIGGNPVTHGLVASLNRPGGNVTGFPAFVDTMGGKWLELLKEIAPRTTRIGFIHHPEVAPHRGLLRAAQASAPSLEIELAPLAVQNVNDIRSAITAFAAGGNGALATASHAVTYSNRNVIIGLAADHRLPTLFGEPIWIESGGLLAYGSDQLEMFLGAATYVDQILKGSKPAEMPVQLPTKFNLIINLKTAQAIGLPVPATLLVRADRLIE